MKNSCTNSTKAKLISRVIRRIIFLITIITLLPNSAFSQMPDTLWTEDWESGIGSWFADNGVWEVGIPISNPPGNAHSGQNCTGTILAGSYPANANTRIVSPSIDLTTDLQPNEVLELRFWHWFNQFPEDPGVVQISEDDGVMWTTISNSFEWNSDGWTHYLIDISIYANSTIRLAFYFTSSGGNQANGWYIDDISIVKGVFTLNNPEDFELGIGNWYADKGVWQVGVPTTNPPGGAHSGQNCAGTVLGSSYPANANTRLISPKTDLPSLSQRQELQLRFWHWFNQFPEDPGVVQISNDDGVTWTTISNSFQWNSNAWTQYIADISDYADSTVRFAFYFTSSGGNQANGWYVDDISIVKGIFTLNNPEDFELGIGDWYADKGVWEVGLPTAGPDTAHSIPNCAGTVLSGGYPANANTRLISPQITLTPKPEETPGLFFWHWFNIFPEDSAVVQISEDGGPWQTKSNSFSSNSGWTQFFIDLSEYTNSTVRFAFYFTSSGGNQANGWYIDDIRIEGIIDSIWVGISEKGTERPKEFTLQQNYPNPFNPGTTIRYELPKATNVLLVIYNALGQRIRTLVEQEQIFGKYQVAWDGKDDSGRQVASGVYLYRLETEQLAHSRKLLLVR